MGKLRHIAVGRKYDQHLISFLKILLLTITIVAYSCKKDIISAPVKLSKTSDNYKINIIPYSQFLSKVEINSTGSLKEALVNAVNNKLTKGSSASSITSYEIETGNVKQLIVNDTISYVLALKTQTSRARHFQNITIQTAKGITIAFLTTYVPTKEWIKEWRLGKHIDTVFRGDINVNRINLSDVVTQSVKTQGKTVSKTGPTNSIDIGGNTIKLLPGECTTYSVYQNVTMPCKYGHYERSSCNYFDTYGTWDFTPGDWPPYEAVVYVGEAMYCAPDAPPTPGGGGGGGGGNTTPNPPGGYDPCDEGPNQNSIKNKNGNGVFTLPPTPCDEQGSPTTPQEIITLIDYLGILGPGYDYLMNNHEFGVEMYNYLEYYDFDTESVMAVNMTIQAVVKGVLSTSNSTSLYSAVGPYLPSPMDPFVFLRYYAMQCAIIKVQNPYLTSNQVSLLAFKEIAHLILDGVGLVPGIGEIADVVNGVIYTIQGDGVNATLSYSSAIPVGGWVAAGIKVAKKGSLNFVLKSDGFIHFGNRGQLRDVLGLAKGDVRQAHHIIPWAKSTNEVIQRAAKSGNAFHMNDLLNGIPLSTTNHLGSHANYDAKILQKLNNFLNLYPNATPSQCYTHVSNVINDVKTAIQNNPGVHINQLNF